MVNLIKYLQHLPLWSVPELNVSDNPVDKVVFEAAFDHLVQKVVCEE